MPLKLDTRLPRWIGKTPATRTAFALVLGLLAVPLLASPVAPQKDKPIKGAGVEVTVTPEMMGAGAVSSGVTLPPIPPVTGSRKNPVASWAKPLPYPILIADRRNNRLIEIAPDKSIVWEFPSPSLKVYRGNEDVNFSADGKLLAVREEDNFDVHIVDYEKRQLTWTYGMPDRRGSGEGLLNYPDDAHLLADGKFLTADIRNCRVLIIDPATNKIATQWGTPGKCKHNPPHELAHPNGATPLRGSCASPARARCCGASRRPAFATRPTRSRPWTASRSSWRTSGSPAEW